jgi:hypothetical protein
METEKKLWFGAKRYGWGWTATTWQAKLITLIYIVGLVHSWTQSYREHSLSETLLHFALDFAILTGFYLAICYYTGEKLAWRWGDKKPEAAPAPAPAAPAPEDKKIPEAQP